MRRADHSRCIIRQQTRRRREGASVNRSGLHPQWENYFDYDAVWLDGVDAGTGTHRVRAAKAPGGELHPGVLLSAVFRVEQKHVQTAGRFDFGR